MNGNMGFYGLPLVDEREVLNLTNKPPGGGQVELRVAEAPEPRLISPYGRSLRPHRV